MEPVIVGTNILFSSLLQHGSKFHELLITGEYQFYVCELTLVELFRHKAWWHILELESIQERKTDAGKYPAVIEKKGRSPDQYPE